MTRTSSSKTSHDLVHLLQGLGAGLAGLAPAEMTPRERADLLLAIERASGTLTAARSRLLAVAERSGDWRASGDRSAAAWHGRASGVGPTQARAQVRQARTMERMPEVARAVEGGAITTAHLDALARVADEASAPAQHVLDDARVQAELVGMAGRQDPETFAKAVRRRLAEQDPAALDRSWARQRSERYLVLSSTPMGLRLQGQVDPIAGQVVRRALEALSPRPADGDDRTPDQRRADALEAMSHAVLGDPATTSGAAVRPHVSLVMTDASLAAHRELEAARAAVRQASGGGVVGPPADGAGDGVRGEAAAEPAGPATHRAAPVPYAPAVLEDGTPVPPRAVARILCDCEVTRVALDSRSMPMDVGRTKRVYDGHLRRAVIVRDGACSWPGCTHHARWCEIHHATWWSRGGETSIENAVLMCTFHHHRVHELDLRITRHPLAPGEVPRNGVARVRYEFRRPDGKLFVPDALDARDRDGHHAAPGHASAHRSPPPPGHAPPRQARTRRGPMTNGPPRARAERTGTHGSGAPLFD